MTDQANYRDNREFMGTRSHRIHQKKSADQMNRAQRFFENKSQLSVQFIKYAMAGVVGTGIHFLIFSALNETLLPADRSQEGIQRGWNFFWSFTIAFTLANIVAYLLNRRWVFQPGRHSQMKELSLFSLFAVAAYLLGTPLGAYLVAKYPLNEYFVYLMVAVSSILVNFLGRKFVVFKH